MTPADIDLDAVVTLLRCTADACLRGDKQLMGMYSVAQDLGYLQTWVGTKAFNVAREARVRVEAFMPPFTAYEYTCLEVAIRIEEGWVP